MELGVADTSDLTREDVAHDDGAWHYATHHDIANVIGQFTLANILHMAKKTKEASRFYRNAYEMHSGSPDEYPLAESLLQVRLLCLLKSALPLPDGEMIELRKLNEKMYTYLRGIEFAWKSENKFPALKIMGNCFEAFHTGEECDCLYLEVALRCYNDIFRPSSTPIPPMLYMFWDKNPPGEIQNNIEYHSDLLGSRFKIYDREEAAEFLDSFYGREARDLFVKVRHPAEAADFFRVHAIHQHGGWWIDADLKLINDSVIRNGFGSQLYVTDNYYIHNDFFGSTPNSPLLQDCLLSLYRNSYLHHGLFIAYKTGPGIFNRAVNRLIYRSLNSDDKLQIDIRDNTSFRTVIEEIEAPYKLTSPNWQIA